MLRMLTARAATSPTVRKGAIDSISIRQAQRGPLFVLIRIKM